MSIVKPSGHIFVITGPSGVGKGTICGHLIQKMASRLCLSISATSRPMRSTEREGVDYFFKTRDQFEQMILENALLEWAEYNGSYYGTPRSFVEDKINEGKGVILEIDVQGALQVKESFPLACLIFIEPPSLEALESRLHLRATNTEDDIRNRLAIARQELALKGQFDYVVINDVLSVCQNRIEDIIELWLKE